MISLLFNDVRLNVRKFQHQLAHHREAFLEAPVLAPVQPAARAIIAELSRPQSPVFQGVVHGSA